MNPVEQARIAFQKGDVRGAIAMLQSGAERGDAASCVELGFCNLQGVGMPRDLVRSRAYFAQAAALGDPRAQAIHTAFVANGTGGPSDFAEARRLLAAQNGPDAARQRALLDAMDLTEAGDPRSPLPAPRALSERPLVQLLPGLLTPEECGYLIDAAAPAFQPAQVGHNAMGGQARNLVRTCDTASFPWIAENPAIHAINRRIAAASGTAVECGEPLQILRYRPGQEFKPHYDCTEATDNQRVLTVLVYLNAGYDGGETLFLKTGLKIRGEIGDALLFRNADSDGRPDPQSLHAGLPVLAGEKLIASRWIRAKRFGPTTK